MLWYRSLACTCWLIVLPDKQVSGQAGSGVALPHRLSVQPFNADDQPLTALRQRLLAVALHQRLGGAPDVDLLDDNHHSRRRQQAVQATSSRNIVRPPLVMRMRDVRVI